jgi:hypothetical protein
MTLCRLLGIGPDRSTASPAANGDTRRRAAARDRETLAVERQAEWLKGVPGGSGSAGIDRALVERNGLRLREVEDQLRDAQSGSVPDTNARTSNLERPTQRRRVRLNSDKWGGVR